MATITRGVSGIGAPVATRGGTGAGALSTPTRYVLAGLRLALGWVFLWAFLDKLFWLGHETRPAAASR